MRRVIHVRRQVRLLGTVQRFAEVENKKPHDVPLSDCLAPILAEHIRLYPPTEVTLPWQVPGRRPRYLHVAGDAAGWPGSEPHRLQCLLLASRTRGGRYPGTPVTMACTI
jgi:hypothetical protein